MPSWFSELSKAGNYVRVCVLGKGEDKPDHHRPNSIAYVKHFAEIFSIARQLFNPLANIDLPYTVQTLFNLLNPPQEAKYLLVVDHHFWGKYH